MNWWVRSIKRFCATLNYIEHFLILDFAVTGCISVSAFASLLGIPIGIMSSARGLKICTVTAGIKKVYINNQEKEEEIRWNSVVSKIKIK